MSFKKIYIFSLGLLAISCIVFVYFSLSSLIFGGKNSGEIKKVDYPKIEGSGNVSETTPICIKNPNEVRVYAYMFHYIIPDKYVDKGNKIEYGNSISPDTLEGILQILSEVRARNKVQVVSLSDLENFNKTHCFPSKNIALLTVDDGWDDGYNFLFPLAKKYNMKFNLAIIADKVSTTSSEINNFLNEHEIQEMLDSKLITLASHTYSHIELQNLTDPVLKKELFSSKEALERWFHISINTIVYPSGKYDDFTLQKAKESGYSFGFTTKRGVITQEDLNKNSFTLPRIRVNRDTDIPRAFLFE